MQLWSGSRERRSVAQQRLVVLGAAEARLDRDLREALDGPQHQVELIRTERTLAPEEWDAALDHLEEADTVLVVVSAVATTEPVWIRLVEHAVALDVGLVVIEAEPVELTAWPVALRDARPPVVESTAPGWSSGLAELISDAHADRPAGWTPPERPLAPEADVASAPTRPVGPDTSSVAIDEDVQFTLYRPGSVSPRRWHWLLLFAHKSEGGPELDDPLAEVRRQAESVLGADAQDYGTLTADSTGALRRGTTLLIEPWLDGATFNPPTVELQWWEPVHRADFRFQVAEGAPAVARGGVRIFAGVVLIGELTMSIRVAAGEDAAAAPQRADRFRRIFASYAHADAQVVDRLAAAVGVLGDEYIIDSRSLRSGEDWERRIEGFIEQADVFQLFWSSNALRSPHVLAECRHALSLDREGFIRPVFWEQPIPQDVERDLPPAPIRRLHFSRLMDDDEQSTAAGIPPPPAPHPPPPPAYGAAYPPPPPATTPGPIRPSPKTPPAKSTQRRSRIPWAAAALVAVLGVGAGAFALQGGGGNGENSAEPPQTTGGAAPPVATTSVGEGTSPTVAPTTNTGGTPAPTGPTATEPPATDVATTNLPTPCDAACLRAAFPFMDEGECVAADALPDLESNAELCLLSSPSSGGPVRFRGAATADDLDVGGYIEQLGRRTAAQVTGEGRWSRDGVERGPYVDFTWPAPEDPYPACRAWGEDGAQAVGWVCAADAATALELWERATS
jgi:TIR domain